MSERDEQPLPGLEAFGTELTRVAHERFGPRRRRKRLSRPVIVALAGSLLVVGGAGAGALLDEGDPAPRQLWAPPRSHALTPPKLVLTVPDPSGILPWGVALYRSTDGKRCVLWGRLKGGRMGELRDRTFRPYGSDRLGMCKLMDEPTSGSFTPGYDPGPPPRTYVVGQFGRAVTAVRITLGGQTRRVVPGPGGVVFVLFDGELDKRDLDLQLEKR